MIILDGGLGRELKAMGAPFRQPEWSALALMEGAEYVRAAHDAFLQAGADIITTNSYAIVPFHIGEDVFKSRASELLRLSGKLARAAADDAERHRNDHQNSPNHPCGLISVMVIIRFLLVYSHQIPPCSRDITLVMCAW